MSGEIFWIEFDDSFKLSNGIRELPQAGLSQSELKMQCGNRRINPFGLLQGLNRWFGLIQTQVSAAHEVKSRCIVVVEAEHLPALCDYIGAIISEQTGVGQVQAGVWISRCQ